MRIWRPFVEFGRRLFGVAKRSINSLPWNAGGSVSGRPSAELALSVVPFFACVRLLAEQLSALPLQAYREVGDRRERVADPPLLRKPAARGTRVKWVRQLVVSLATRGNAYGLITGFDGLGYPTGIEWLHPDEVHVDETMPTLPRYYWRGVEVPRERIVHIVFFPLPGRVKGLSPVSAFAATIGVGLNSTNYGATWFENGGTPPGTFKNTAQTIDNEQAEIISDRLVSRIRRGRPIVYGSDWDYTALSVNPEESQFIETMKLNATQIAAIFGVPAEMVGGESGGPLTYNTPALNGEALLKWTLRPGWMVLIEDELSALLPQPRFVKFNADAVVRADLKTRYDAYAIALDKKFMSINEVRALEDLAPVPGGDTIDLSTPPPPPPVDQPPAPPVDQPPARNGHRLKEITVV